MLLLFQVSYFKIDEFKKSQDYEFLRESIILEKFFSENEMFWDKSPKELSAIEFHAVLC